MAVTAFVSHLINKIRWQPLPKNTLHRRESDTFVTGSLEYGQKNKLCLWSYQTGKENMEEQLDGLPSFTNQIGNVNGEPVMVNSVDSEGVREIKFLSRDLLAVALSDGSVDLYQIQNTVLKRHQHWEKLHTFPYDKAECTSLAIRNDDIVSVGEDGRIVVVNMHKNEVSRAIDDADSCSLTSVVFLRQAEIATGNLHGLLKVWDLRSGDSTQPVRSLVSPGKQVSVMCMDQHPTQQFVIAVGGGDGGIYIWDLRQEHQPIREINGYLAPITEIKFHPSHPNNLFASSMDGGLYQWTASELRDIRSILPGAKLPATGLESISKPSGNPWINYTSATHSLEVLSMLPDSVLPINSFDIDETTLISTSDNHAIYIIPDVNL